MAAKIRAKDLISLVIMAHFATPADGAKTAGEHATVVVTTVSSNGKP